MQKVAVVQERKSRMTPTSALKRTGAGGADRGALAPDEEVTTGAEFPTGGSVAVTVGR